mgnify:CR=1 FL=1
MVESVGRYGPIVAHCHGDETDGMPGRVEGEQVRAPVMVSAPLPGESRCVDMDSG